MEKRLLISICISVLLIMAFVGKTIYSSEIPDGFGEIKFGMTKDEVKQILQRKGRSLLIEGRKYADFDLGKDRLFGAKYMIHCSFTPITQRCTSIILAFYASERLYRMIRKTLIEKYGMPIAGDMWKLGNITIQLISGEKEIDLIYSDSELENKAEEEQERLDKKVIDKDKDRL